jgi:hypothetical protein
MTTIGQSCYTPRNEVVGGYTGFTMSVRLTCPIETSFQKYLQMLKNLDEMSNFYRGSSIDASYQVSVHLGYELFGNMKYLTKSLNHHYEVHDIVIGPADRKSKMAATTDHSINTGPYEENTEIYSSLKLLY